MALSYVNIIVALMAFLVTAASGKIIIPILKKMKFGQTILEIGPKWHSDKEGTPTMGGIMFIIGIFLAVVVGAVFLSFENADASNQLIGIAAAMFLAIGFGAIGFIDDYVKVAKKRNLGLTSKQKLVLQFFIAIVYVAVLMMIGFDTKTTIPFAGQVELGIFYWILIVILIVGFANAVNFTDGLDGLCSSVTFFAALSLFVIATLARDNWVAMIALAAAGGCAGFLAWNFHPASVFMGDTGSLFFGGIIAAIAIQLDVPILLLPVGIIYFCEIGSVVLQVVYFKATKGKRLFKMAPLHHHFEMTGWSETKVVAVFSVVTILFGALSVALYYFG